MRLSNFQYTPRAISLDLQFSSQKGSEKWNKKITGALFILIHDAVIIFCLITTSSETFSIIILAQECACPAWLKCKGKGVASLSWWWFKSGPRCYSNPTWNHTQQPWRSEKGLRSSFTVRLHERRPPKQNLETKFEISQSQVDMKVRNVKTITDTRFP